MGNYFFNKESSRKEKVIFYLTILIPVLVIPLIMGIVGLNVNSNLQNNFGGSILKIYFLYELPLFFIFYLAWGLLYNAFLNLNRKVYSIVISIIFFILLMLLVLVHLFFSFAPW